MALGPNCIPLTNARKSNNIRVYETMITLFEQGFSSRYLRVPKVEFVIEIADRKSGVKLNTRRNVPKKRIN